MLDPESERRLVLLCCLFHGVRHGTVEAPAIALVAHPYCQLEPVPPQTSLMKSKVSRYHGYRFPAQIISHAVWLYHRFCLSFRDVEELLAERGVIVSHETVRQWCQKFGLDYAQNLRRRRGRKGDIWHLDELFVNIQGKRHYLWRAVDQDGDVIDILV